jgi:putative transferase (TIGR04331 family)
MPTTLVTGMDNLDQEFSSKIVDSLLTELADVFCSEQDHYCSPRFVERVLRYWLENFVEIAFVEWRNANSGNSLDQRLEIQTNTIAITSRATTEMRQLLEVSQDAGWRYMLFTDAYKFTATKTLDFDQVPGGRSSFATLPERYRFGRRFLIETLKKYALKSKFVLATTHLPRIAEFILALRLRTVPLRWIEPSIESPLISSNVRISISKELSKTGINPFEEFVRAALAYYLPVSVVENRKKILQSVDQFSPKVAQVIFSANLHFSSDSFAFWVAASCDSRSVLFISQHGGLNGQGRIPSVDEKVEAKIAHRYCHWGWSNDLSTIRVPAQVNVWARKRRRIVDVGVFLLMTDSTFRFKRRIQSDSEQYRRLVLATYAAFPIDHRDSVVVRLHKDHDRYDASHFEMWNSHFPLARIDDGNLSIHRLYKNARLVICTTLGTTEIECFGRNIPVVLSLDRDLHRPRESFADLLSEMESVGLVHFNRESLRAFLDKNLDDLGSWWNSAVVQQTVSKYMNNYGYMPRRPISELARILREAERSSRKRSLPQSNQ